MDFFYERRSNKITTLRGELEWEAHLHKDVEIVFMRRGTIDVYIDGVKFVLNKGNCLIIFPNRIHTFMNGSNDLADVVIVSPDYLREYKGLLLNKMPVNPCLASLGTEIETLFDMAYTEDGKYSEEIKLGFCSAIVGLLLKNMSLRDIEGSENKSVQKVLDYCADNYTNDIAIEDVAKYANLSTSYVSHIFNDKLYISFRTYINALRINEAKRLIESEKLSSTEIAYEIGFGSTRTFNRAFASNVGCSPSEYKKRLKSTD